jgi:hypothetical protein
VCSTANNGAKHKKKCEQRLLERGTASRDPQDRPSAANQSGRSRSRSPTARSHSLPSHHAMLADSAGLEAPAAAEAAAATTLHTAAASEARADPQPHPAVEVLPSVENLAINSADIVMRQVDTPAAHVEPQPIPVVPLSAVPSAVSPIAPEIRPAPFVPYKSRFRHAEVTGHLLQLCKDAAHRGSGQGFSEAFDLLLQLPGLVLTGGNGRSRARKVNRRLELLM